MCVYVCACVCFLRGGKANPYIAAIDGIPVPFSTPLTYIYIHTGQFSQQHPGLEATPIELEAVRRELEEIENSLNEDSITYTTLSSTTTIRGGGGGKTNLPPPVPTTTTTIVDLDNQLATAKKLRNLLSTSREIVIQDVLERKFIPRLLDWIKLSQSPAIQLEALWALTNIAAGTTEHTNILLQHNPVPALVDLLDSPNEDVLEQAIWVLGNIAGEGAASRDIVLNHGALPPLVACIERHQNSQQILRIGSWALNNLCDSQPRPVLDIVLLMPVLHALLRSEDSEVLTHTCWALSHLCDGPSAHIKVVVEANICWRLVELLQHRSWRVTKPALR